MIGKLRARRLSRHVLGLMSLFAALALSGMLFVVHQAIIQADETALTWQRQLVRHGIEEQLARLSHDQESVTFWDDAVLEAERRHILWLHENLGVWMFDYFGHDRVFVLSPSGELIYAMDGGVADISPKAFEVVTQLTPHLIALRARLATAGEDGAVAERNILLVDERPAIMSAMPILPHSDRITVPPGTEHVLVSVQFLDGAFLTKLRNLYVLAGARIALEDAYAPHEARLPIFDPDDRPVAYLVWDPRLPGRQILATILPIASSAGVLLLTLVVFFSRRVYRTSAALEASEAHASHLAYHDVLTGLPNRAQLIHRLDRALPRSPRERMALLIVDLDRFKEVNDTFGHQAGDEVIRDFAGRVAMHLRRSDSIARLGGDEFAILLRNLQSEDEISAFCGHVLACGQTPFDVTGGEASIGVSIGYALVQPGVDRSELLRRADIALYSAKRRGRDCYCAFTEDMDVAVQARHQIEQDLRAALAANGEGLTIHYQPLVSSSNGKIRGVEALVRWHHCSLGPIAPSAFIPIAEAAGLITKLDEWVLRNACRAARQWPGLALSVNVSPLSFGRGGLAHRVLGLLDEEGFDPARLEVEVTESVLLDDTVEVGAELRILRAHGVRIALDDFGTGYSSLSHLRALEVDKVKVDRSFIQHLGHGSDSMAIVDAIIELGHSLGLAVTAEGVETELQREYLRAAGCDEVQGFLFSTPLAADDLSALLARRAESSMTA